MIHGATSLSKINKSERADTRLKLVLLVTRWEKQILTLTLAAGCFSECLLL